MQERQTNSSNGISSSPWERQIDTNKSEYLSRSCYHYFFLLVKQKCKTRKNVMKDRYS